MPKRIFITGTGMICAAGNNVSKVLFSLKHSITGISSLKNINTIHNNIPFAEVRLSNNELLEIAGIYKDTEKYSRTALFGIIAASEAMKGKENKTPQRIGLVSATTVGGMPLNEIYYKDFLQAASHKNIIESLDCAENTEQIADRFNIKHYIATVSTACSSSANAILIGARLIRHNRLDKVLVGGTDALTRFTISGFNSLEILSHEPCKPFDENRNGITLGEGAGYLLLESEETADPGSIICEVAGYGNANDAFHITASSPEGKGATLAMKKALESAKISPGEIDYINAHGTGTYMNDLSELTALAKVFNNNIPKFSSTKGFTGHTLAAAGAIEAIISCLAIKHSFIPANLNYKNRMKEIPFEPVNEFIDNFEVYNVLSNSFGFGGNNTSIILSKY
jgi:3-oxoacyl-(acyl-carrier-protein) synthase